MKKLDRIVHTAVLAVIVIAAAAFAFTARGAEGLAGVAAGAAVAAALCVITGRLQASAREATGPRVVQAMMASLGIGFAVVAGSVLVAAIAWPRGAPSFAFTLLGLYVAHRFLGSWRDFSRSSDARERRSSRDVLEVL